MLGCLKGLLDFYGYKCIEIVDREGGELDLLSVWFVKYMGVSERGVRE